VPVPEVPPEVPEFEVYPGGEILVTWSRLGGSGSCWYNDGMRDEAKKQSARMLGESCRGLARRLSNVEGKKDSTDVYLVLELGGVLAAAMSTEDDHVAHLVSSMSRSLRLAWQRRRSGS
jgi:hypothetical protein